MSLINPTCKTCSLSTIEKSNEDLAKAIYDKLPKSAEDILEKDKVRVVLQYVAEHIDGWLSKSDGVQVTEERNLPLQDNLDSIVPNVMKFYEYCEQKHEEMCICCSVEGGLCVEEGTLIKCIPELLAYTGDIFLCLDPETGAYRFKRSLDHFTRMAKIPPGSVVWCEHGIVDEDLKKTYCEIPTGAAESGLVNFYVNSQYIRKPDGESLYRLYDR